MNQLPEDLFTLRYATCDQWVEAVVSDFNEFLNDHAQAEKKASGMAMSMLSHYPDRPELVSAMINLSIEEMCHFRDVIALMQTRNLALTPDKKDPYVNAIRKLMRDGRSEYMLDRLLTAAVIEARGCERFNILGQRLKEPSLAKFYQTLAESEARHHLLFIELAQRYFDLTDIQPRLDELLDQEAAITSALPIRAALH